MHLRSKSLFITILNPSQKILNVFLMRNNTAQLEFYKTVQKDKLII
jgi:hypothetical protein